MSSLIYTVHNKTGLLQNIAKKDPCFWVEGALKPNENERELIA